MRIKLTTQTIIWKMSLTVVLQQTSRSNSSVGLFSLTIERQSQELNSLHEQWSANITFYGRTYIISN